MLPFQLDTQYNLEQILMTLAAISYTSDPALIPQQLANPGYATQNEWKLVWGPVNILDNLMYVTKYDSTGGNIFAVTIRGTVLDAGLKTLVDLFEDLEVSVMLPWKYPEVPNAAVAAGTLAGLDILTSMRDPVTGKTLFEFLSATPQSAICVTGHSLGGCLTSVLGPWLKYQFEQAGIVQLVLPCSFAGPTAGNQAFADWYDQLYEIPTYRYYNTIDAIPMAWNNLDGIKALFTGGPACPWEMKDLIDLVEDWLWAAGATYAQTNGNGNPLTGTVAETNSWFTEMGHQHDHNTYLTLLNAPIVSLTSAITVKRYHPSLLQEQKPV